VGISQTDTDAELDWTVRKCLELRLFSDYEGSDRWQRSVQEINGELLVISQLTLYGDCSKGRRPCFDSSAKSILAILAVLAILAILAVDLYNHFVDKLRASGLKVETSEFSAMMSVEIENDGPVTLILEHEAE
jgi:D-tyrosyl-tRNA(Tyr) deacylase